MQIKPFGVELWLNDYEDQAQLNLAETSISALTIRELLELTGAGDDFTDQLLDARMIYGHIPGSPSIRKAIASLYESVAPERVTLTHGTIGANHLAHMVLTNAGDHVISFEPSYEQHAEIARSIGANVTVLPLREEDGFLPRIEEIALAITPRTKLICLTNPNNPTGTLIGEDMMRDIVKIARNAGAYVLVDEVYRGVEGDGVTPCPSIVDLYEKGVATSGISKAFSLPGLRVGWVVYPEELADEFATQRDYSIISVGVLDDMLAALAIENQDVLLKRSRTIMDRNRAIVDEWLAGEPRMSWTRPDAGSAALLKLHPVIDDREFALGLLNETGVFITPGSAFDMPGYYRLGYTCDADVLREGFRRMSAYMDQLGLTAQSK